MKPMCIVFWRTFGISNSTDKRAMMAIRTKLVKIMIMGHTLGAVWIIFL